MSWDAQVPSYSEPDSGRIKITPLIALIVLAIIAFVLLYWCSGTTMLKCYIISASDEIAKKHAVINSTIERELGIANSFMPSNASILGIEDLMQLRNASAHASEIEKAMLVSRISAKVEESEEESYKMIWAPVLACALSGCENSVYIQAAGLLAARQPNWAANAMITQAAYMYNAHIGGDVAGKAAAIAKINRLVEAYGDKETKDAWKALNSCKGDCPLFEELVLEFIEKAKRN